MRATEIATKPKAPFKKKKQGLMAATVREVLISHIMFLIFQ